jgi:O-antigen ligase
LSAAPATAAPAAGRVRAVAIATVVAAVVLGAVAGGLIAHGAGAAVLALALVLVPVGLWKKPHLTPAGLVACALMVEQFGQVPPTGDTVSLTAPVPVDPPIAPEPLTAHIPLFHGMGGLHVAPADLLIVLACVIVLARSADRTRPRTVVWYALLGLLGAVAWGTALGILHHGDIRIAFMETRPYAYLAATYVLTSSLARDRRALRAVLWALVVCAALKALQGLVIFVQVRHMNPRPEAVLGHEESFFFALLAFLVLALWLWNVDGRLRATATALAPVVALADLANDRRAAWLVLGGGLMTLVAVGLRALPERRHILARGIAVVLVLSAVYVPAYWNKTGGLAQPARALRSMVSPDSRDALSDLYRIQENANLKVNIRESDGIGTGFGVPIRYTLPITDISGIDPLIAYIPHNGVLYVLMRMGLVGGVALWTLLAAGIVTALRVARGADRELAVVGAVVAAALVAYALMGAVDQGFFFYRVAFVVGTLLGLADGAVASPPRGLVFRGRRRTRSGETLLRL